MVATATRRPYGIKGEELLKWMLNNTERTDGGCMEWLGAMSPTGCARIAHEGEIKVVHRLVYALAYGEDYHALPRTHFVVHICENKKCIRVSHLVLEHKSVHVGRRQRELVKAGKHLFPMKHHRGETHPQAKLTDDNVRAIRALLKQGYTQTNIAKEFGVTQGTISKIHNRWHWLHLR